LDRIEIAEAVRPAFEEGGRVSRDELIRTAFARGASAEVVAALGSLPPRQFGRLNELWQSLPEMPIRDSEPVS
jgi:hypothetical protein